LDDGDLRPDDVVVIAYGEDRLNDAVSAGEALAHRGIEVRSARATSLLDPDTMDFVRSSVGRRVVLCVQRRCIGTETIGGFLSKCGHCGKDVALRTIPDTGTLFLTGVALAGGWWTG
jgi:hypothetical protein